MWHIWRNFRFLDICHVDKSEISPHGRFVLHRYHTGFTFLHFAYWTCVLNALQCNVCNPTGAAQCLLNVTFYLKPRRRRCKKNHCSPPECALQCICTMHYAATLCKQKQLSLAMENLHLTRAFVAIVHFKSANACSFSCKATPFANYHARISLQGQKFTFFGNHVLPKMVFRTVYLSEVNETISLLKFALHTIVL